MGLTEQSHSRNLSWVQGAVGKNFRLTQMVGLYRTNVGSAQFQGGRDVLRATFAYLPSDIPDCFQHWFSGTEQGFLLPQLLPLEPENTCKPREAGLTCSHHPVSSQDQKEAELTGMRLSLGLVL